MLCKKTYPCYVKQKNLSLLLLQKIPVKAVSHWVGCKKVRRIADDLCFHTKHETIDRLIHDCTLGGADQQCLFP